MRALPTRSPPAFMAVRLQLAYGSGVISADSSLVELYGGAICPGLSNHQTASADSTFKYETATVRRPPPSDGRKLGGRWLFSGMSLKTMVGGSLA